MYFLYISGLNFWGGYVIIVVMLILGTVLENNEK